MSKQRRLHDWLDPFLGRLQKEIDTNKTITREFVLRDCWEQALINENLYKCCEEIQKQLLDLINNRHDELKLDVPEDN